MKIGGLQKFSLIDYPQKMSAIIFTSTCPFRCFFCYNPELVLPEKIKKHPLLPEEKVLDFLKKRKGLLEGVVLTGGEPLMQKDVIEFIRKIKKMGYLIKVDTNGFYPEVLKKLLDGDLLDYVAMDIKAPKKKYGKITGIKIDLEKIEKSIRLLKNSQIDYEFRTTVGDFLTKKDIIEIAEWIKGSSKYYLQNFKPGETIRGDLKPYPEEELIGIVKEISPYFKICQKR